MSGVGDEGVADLLGERFGGEWMRWRGGVEGVDDARLWAQFRTDGEGRTVLVGVLLLTDGITSEVLRRVPVGGLEAARRAPGGVGVELGRLRPLRRDGLSPVEFSELVAEHYRVWAGHTSRPAAAMARESGVSSSTMHSWIHGARVRGFLPAAHRGKRA